MFSCSQLYLKDFASPAMQSGWVTLPALFIYNINPCHCIKYSTAFPASKSKSCINMPPISVCHITYYICGFRQVAGLINNNTTSFSKETTILVYQHPSCFHNFTIVGIIRNDDMFGCLNLFRSSIQAARAVNRHSVKCS